MLKVSFKDNFKKVQIFNDKVTTVTLTGKVKLPKWLSILPSEIAYWVGHHPTVDFDIIYAYDEAIIIASGKSICADGDVFNAGIGKRIAECRAKIRIYKFMQTLTKMLCEYYQSIVFGEDVAVYDMDICSGNSILYTNTKYTELLEHERHHLSELLQKTV